MIPFRPTLLAAFTSTALTLLVTSCGGGDKKADGASAETPPDPAKASAVAAEAQAYYDANPDRFTVATPADLPADLVWENGADEPEMGSPEAKKGGTYNFFLSDFPRTLRLVGPDASGAFRQYLLDSTQIGLTIPHMDTMGTVPGLAMEWAIAPDKKTAYYRINPDARYSDGHPILADDFFFTFFFMQSPHLAAPWYQEFYKSKFTNITKFDDHTISLTYSEAKPDVLYWLAAVRPIPQHFYSEFGEDFVERYNFRSEPTTSAYEILPENLKKGKSVTLTRVENWWAKDRKHFRYRYNPDKVRLQTIRDPAKAFEAFKAGEIDAHTLSLPEFWHKKLPDDHELVQSGYIEKSTFYNKVPPPSWSITCNTSKAPLDNRDIRLGLHHACNWDLVIKEVFYGDYTRMQTYCDDFGIGTHPSLKPRNFDPEKAAEYFAKAGYTKRGPDGILVNEAGEKLQLSLTTGYKRLEDVCTVIKQEAVKAGLQIDLDILEMTAAWKKADEKKHQLQLAAKNTSAELYPRFWESWHSYHAYNEDGSLKVDTNNDTVTALPELDKLIDEYRASSDLDRIVELSHEITEMIHEHGAFIPTWKRPFLRLGKWRWMRYPDYFDHKTTRLFEESWVFWIDEDMKKETLAAKKKGETFPPVIEVFDQYK